MDEQMPPLNHYDAAAHMYPCDLEEFKEGEIVREAFSIPVGSPTHGESVPLWTTEQMFAYAKEYAEALSQPAAQGDSSHPAGGEFGGVPHPATVESFIGESEQADFEDDTWTFKMQPGYSVGAGFYRITYIGLTAPKDGWS